MILLSGCYLNLQGQCRNCVYDDVEPGPEIIEEVIDTAVEIDDEQLPGDPLQEPVDDMFDVVPDATEEEAAEEPPACNPVMCPLGCHVTEPRCNRLQPSNYDPSGFYGEISNGLSVAESDAVTVNTDEGSIIGTSTTIYRPAWGQGEAANGIHWDIVDQGSGVMLSVFGMASLTLPATSKIIVTGSHPAAFYVVGDALIMGIIEARALQSRPGAGGGAGGAGNCRPGDVCGSDSNGKGGGNANAPHGPAQSGGGGGGSLGSGGAGGNSVYYSTTYVGGGSGGNPIVNVPLIPLTGGCGGGAGGGPDSDGGDGGYGGGGGGGIEISSGGVLTITAGGGIDTAGAGGQCGLYGAGGGGGGAGGSILIEAIMITNGGLLAANGGGGGSGGIDIYTYCGGSGWDGGFDESAAPGGTGGGYGGNGAGGGGGGSDSGESASSGYNAGGGGGAAGRIRFNYATSVITGRCSPSTISVSDYVSGW